MDTTCHHRPLCPYRSRRGMVFGVCRGLAEHLNISVGWTRALTLLVFLYTGFWPVGVVYLVAAFLLNREPVHRLESPRPAGHRVKESFDNLDRRIRRMEDVVTSKNYDWDRRLRQS